MKISSPSANRKRVEITKAAFDEGREANHALYVDASGHDLYLAPAGRNADDVRLASILEFEPEDPDIYACNVQLLEKND